MGDKVNFAGDPSIAAGLANIGALFDPRAAAEGAAMQARTRNFDAETGYHTARTGALNDRRKFLGDDAALLAAGYTPRQILAFRMTGAENGLADLFSGVRTDLGTQEVVREGGDRRKGSLLLNVTGATNADSAFTQEEANTIRAQQIAAELAKAEKTATITQQGVTARADAKAKANPGGNKDETYAFTPEQVNGPVRQAIVDLYHAGSKDTGDYTTLDEGLIRKIIDTQQTLISTGLSTRSSSLNDALGALGLVNSDDAKDRFDKTVALEDAPGLGTGDTETVVGITPKKAAEVEPSELIPGDPALETRRFMEIPLESARDMLPQIRDQAEVGSLFKLGNRVYEKVQMPDGTSALVAVR
jgi:hypothetical protein